MGFFFTLESVWGLESVMLNTHKKPVFWSFDVDTSANLTWIYTSANRSCLRGLQTASRRSATKGFVRAYESYLHFNYMCRLMYFQAQRRVCIVGSLGFIGHVRSQVAGHACVEREINEKEIWMCKGYFQILRNLLCKNDWPNSYQNLQMSC